MVSPDFESQLTQQKVIGVCSLRTHHLPVTWAKCKKCITALVMNQLNIFATLFDCQLCAIYITNLLEYARILRSCTAELLAGVSHWFEDHDISVVCVKHCYPMNVQFV